MDMRRGKRKKVNGVIAYARQAGSWLLRFEILLLSLVYLYFVISDTVPPAAWALVALIWLARWWTTGRLSRKTPLDFPILVIVIWLPLSLWVSTNWFLSLPKVDGVLLSVAFYYAVVNGISTRKDLAWATLWLVLVYLAIALAGIVGTDWAQGKIVSAGFIYDRLPRFIQGIPRSIAGGFARNGVGGTLTLTIPFLASLLFVRSFLFADVAEVLRVWLPRLIAVALVLSFITLGLTQSRGAILGTAVGLTALALVRERRVAWLVAAGGVVLVFLIILGQGNALLEVLLRMDAKSGTLASRIEVWQRGIWMVQDFPFTGIGIGTYNDIAHLMYPFFIAAPDELVAHAHNNLLQVAVDMGIPVLVAYSAMLTCFALMAVRAFKTVTDTGMKAVIAGAALGMLAHQAFGLTDAFMLGTKPGVLLWVFLALVMIAGRREFSGSVTR